MAYRGLGGSIWLAMAAVLGISVVAPAAVDRWKDANSGSFADGTRWVDGSAPTATDSARFEVPASYDVLFDSDPVNDDLYVSDGVVRFLGDGGARLYSVTGASGNQDFEVTDGAALTLGAVGQPLDVLVGSDLVVQRGGRLDILYGSEVTTNDLQVGLFSGADSELVVGGPGSSLTVTGGGSHFLGWAGSRGDLVFWNSANGSIAGRLCLPLSIIDNSQGNLRVESGATVSMETLIVGADGKTGQRGTVTVNGIGAQITQTGTSALVLGADANSPGELLVTGGGVFTTATGVTMVHPTGQIEIDSGTFNAHGDMTIDGGTLTCESAGTLALSDAVTVTVTGAGVMTFESSYSLRTAATIDITGAGSRLESTWGGLEVGGDGQVNVTNGGAVSLTYAMAELRVGALDGNGTLNITDAGTVSCGHGLIDSGGDSHGTVTVSDLGSSWTTGEVVIGFTGSGELNVTDGGVVSSQNSYLAYNADSDGRATVDGDGSTWTVASLFLVGTWGRGTLEITDGGAVLSPGGTIGYGSDSVGAVRVDGNGTVWTNSQPLCVGDSGEGTLEITNGGAVSSASGSIGDSASGVGIASVDGSESAWTGLDRLDVGGHGRGTLIITAGGTVSDANAYVGLELDSNGTVTVDGAGSNWTHSALLSVGQAGRGTVEVSGEGNVSSVETRIGAGFGSDGAVTVCGAGSTWDTDDWLYIGYLGAGRATVSQGGLAACDHVYLGYYLGSTGELTVVGEGSTVTVRGNARVGGQVNTSGGPGLLTVGDGAVVNVDGQVRIWSEGTVRLTSGGLLTANEVELAELNATVESLPGSTLRTNTMTNWGDAISVGGSLQIGHAVGSGSGAHAVGAGQSLSVGEDLTIGYDADGALNVSQGGEVHTLRCLIGHEEGASGQVTVDDADLSCDLGSLTVGRAGAGALQIRNGAHVSNADAYLAELSTATASVTVEGAGSTWTCGRMYVGGGVASDGGAADVDIYDGTVAVSETVVVRSQGALNVHGGLAIADEIDLRSGGTFAAASGSTVRVNKLTGFGPTESFGTLELGHTAGVEPASHAVGAGESLSVSEKLVVGRGKDAALAVSDGGTVSSGEGSLGDLPGGIGVVTLDNATWDNAGPLYVGREGFGEIQVSSGGQMDSGAMILGWDYETAGRLRIVGSGSAVGAGGAVQITVGQMGDGILEILDGGRLYGSNGYLGFSNTGEGEALLNGAGSQWSLTGSLYVGGRADAGKGVGEVTVSTGATLSIGQTLTIWDGGTVTLNGGTVRLAALEFGGSEFAFNAGLLNFTGDLTAEVGSLTEILGASHAIGPGRHVDVDGTLTLQTNLSIDGGTLSVGDLEAPAALRFEAGTLNLTDADLAVGASGLFGATLRVGDGQEVNVTNHTTVDPGATLSLQGGTFSSGSLTNGGLIKGDGQIHAALTNAVGGEIRGEAGTHLRLTGSNGENAGRIQLYGGTVEFDEALTNGPGADILGRGALIARLGLTNRGDMALSNGVTDVVGDVNNDTGGRIIVSGRADVTFWDDVHNQGALFKVSADSSATFFGTYSGLDVSGEGGVYFEDDVTPGFSAAVIHFGGDVTFGPSSNLQIELADPENSDPLAPRFDALDVADDVALGGTLSLSWLPVSGDPNSKFGGVYTVLSWGGTRTGNFDGVDSPMAAYLDTSEFADGIEYDDEAGEVRVHLYDLLDGDADLDGVVGRSDLLALRAGHDTGQGGWALGDFDFDGLVEADDYLLWKAHVGSHVPGAVPEPGTLTLLALGGLGVLVRRGRTWRDLTGRR